jgi:hypothetical protein
MGHGVKYPRSGFDTLNGYVALPRMLDKARLKRTDPDCPYFAFEASPLDAKLLTRLKLTGAQVTAWLDEGLDDVAIAERIAAHAGHAELADRQRWSQRFLRTDGWIMHMLDADEGRREPGLVTSLLQGLSNSIFPVMKVVNRVRGLD